MAGQREIERQTRRLQEAEAWLQKMAVDGEGEERLLARRKRQCCGEEDTRDLSEERAERLKGKKRKRKKRNSEVGAGTQDIVEVSRTQKDSPVETDQLAEEEEEEVEEGEEEEEEGDGLKEEEEIMDTGDSSSLIPLGRAGTRSRGRVSLGRRLPEWVQSAELVETDIVGHSHPIEEFSLPRVVIRNLRRSGVTQLFPVQVCVRVCSFCVPISCFFELPSIKFVSPNCCLYQDVCPPSTPPGPCDPWSPLFPGGPPPHPPQWCYSSGHVCMCPNRLWENSLLCGSHCDCTPECCFTPGREGVRGECGGGESEGRRRRVRGEG